MAGSLHVAIVCWLVGGTNALPAENPGLPVARVLYGLSAVQALVQRWLLGMVDDQHFDRTFGRLQHQAELLL